MRETIGSTWVFQLVLIFILIFAAYLALTINYSKSFRVKNEVVSIVERYEGFTDDAIKLVNNYLSANNYQAMGTCPDGWMGAASLSDTASSLVLDTSSSTKYYYCVNKISGYHSAYPDRAYYKIRLFFKFDLPVVGQISTFDVDGQTYELDHTYDGL